jgi:hypothetical protein
MVSRDKKCSDIVEYIYLFINFSMAQQQPLVAQGLPLPKIRDRTQTPQHSVGHPGRVINPTKRPLPDNTQHSQQINIQPPPRRD